MRFGISGTALLAAGSLGRLIEYAQGAKDDGFASFWIGEHISGGFDAVTALTVIGQSVPDIELGSAVVPTYPRHPMVLAGQVLTATCALGPRFTLGIGLSHASMLSDLGLSMDRPIRHLKEFLSILQPLLSEGVVSFDGEMLTCHARSFIRPAFQTPVVVAALGPQALKVAGAMTTGTSLSWVGPRTVAQHIRPPLEAAAGSAGRGAPRIIATVPVCVTDDEPGKRREISERVKSYGQLPSYRIAMEQEGVEAPGDLCLIGGESAVRDLIGEYAESGVTDFVALEIGSRGDEWSRTRALLKECAGTG